MLIIVLIFCSPWLSQLDLLPVPLLPVLFHCCSIAWDTGQGLVWLTQTISFHTLWATLWSKIQSHSLDVTHIVGTSENYWLISRGNKEFWIYSMRLKGELEFAYLWELIGRNTWCDLKHSSYYWIVPQRYSSFWNKTVEFREKCSRVILCYFATLE